MFVRFNTASGKHCCNRLCSTWLHSSPIVSIPQAVSTVATFANISELMTGVYLVSIPQAVSTVATAELISWKNTDDMVSIPQAVSTVATRINLY